MDKGQIIQFDTPEEILSNPKNEFIERFVGKDRLWRRPELINAEDIMIKEYPKIFLERRTGRVKFSEIFKSITVDNGSEFLDDTGMEKSLTSKYLKRTNIYYAHPYCSWERGSNEQANGMIRRFIPKGSLISSIKVKVINDIEQWLNNYPRRILDGASAHELKEKVA